MAAINLPSGGEHKKVQDLDGRFKVNLEGAPLTPEQAMEMFGHPVVDKVQTDPLIKDIIGGKYLENEKETQLPPSSKAPLPGSIEDDILNGEYLKRKHPLN